MTRQSSALTIATPLRIEQLAVRSGARGVDVVHTGIGERRSRRAIARIAGSGPLAIMGVAGGLAAEVRPGDLVVATEVRLADATVVATCPSAPILAGALRRLGLTAHLGPIVTVASPSLSPADRQRLAEAGAIAVDMESAWLAAAAREGRPLAVVRAITDTTDAPLVHPGILVRGPKALAAVRAAAPAVAGWAQAAADRQVVLASPRSFCAGVERAIDIVRLALERYGAPVYVRRQIVHNAHVVAELEQAGAIFVKELDEVPVGARAILAAHGVAPAVRSQAVERQLSVIDATCPLVAKVHQEVRRYAAADHTVVMIGHADHEEVEGSAGEAPDRIRIVGSESEAATVAVDDPARVAFVMQTTLAVDEAERIADVLRGRFPDMRAPRQDDICYATSNRQQAVREIAGDCDLLLVVGSTNSSNSLRLVEVAERAGSSSYLIDDAADIEPQWLTGVGTVGVTAGASAPPRLVEDVVAALAGLGRTTRREHRSIEEDLRFTLPKEVS